MTIPTTITVGAHRYKLTIDDDGFVTGMGNRGMTHPERCLIAVCGTLAPTQQATTILHELLHAILDDGLVNRTDPEDANRAEDFIRGLAPRLLDLLRDNPDLVSYLTTD